MRNHGATSIALEASRRSAATGVDGGHNFTVKFNIGTGDAVTTKVEIPSDAPGANDVRKADRQGVLAASSARPMTTDEGERENVDPDGNSSIPAGYTYLIQLIAHDIVQSVSSLARIDDGRIALDNNRSAPPTNDVNRRRSQNSATVMRR